MSSHHLAQLNIARMKYSLDSPDMLEFVDNLERINSLADKAPGFVWRLQTEGGDATGIDYFGDETIVNMSVWRDLRTLHAYVYRSEHAKIMSKRKRWFDRMQQAYTVLWWVPAGHLPELDEANERLSLLRRSGPSPDAFTFKQAFDPGGDKLKLRDREN
jgi:hypothetical protein